MSVKFVIALIAEIESYSANPSARRAGVAWQRKLAEMRPASEEDAAAMWRYLKTIDAIDSVHAKNLRRQIAARIFEFHSDKRESLSPEFLRLIEAAMSDENI